jgi:Zn-dependent protease
MPSLRQGSIHLFRIAGIDTFLHWSWFLVAAIEIQNQSGRYSSIAWNVAEYLALFLIVLMHEFGHALACRQVGGTANQITLWPLGGVAYVDPPQRPGATLWSIAAGPLVNVALLPIFYGAFILARSSGWALTMPDAFALTQALLYIDIGLLVFNLLPVYPLDGGKILWALLWFPLGRARSLMAATIVGLLGIVGIFGLALWSRSSWYILLAIYMAVSCWRGLRQAQLLLRQAKLPRRQEFSCPSCHTAPPLGDHWKCGKCQQSFDTFEGHGVCPHCSTRYAATACLNCHQQHPMSEWTVGAPAGFGAVNGEVRVN